VVEGGDSWRDVLQYEFLYSELDTRDAFLIKLRVDLVWDETSFARLERAMTACCEALRGDTRIDRWIAEGFWYIGSFVERWTSHESWRADPARPVIDAGCARLFELCDWFFTDNEPSGRTWG
jgi:hypothetical protein